MSKGKYNRKRRRADKKAQDQIARVRLNNEDKVVTSHVEREPTDPPYTKNNKQNDGAMKPSEISNRPSFTDWCVTGFTLALAIVGILQWVTTSSQLNVAKNEERAWIEVLPKGDDKDALKISFTVGQPVGFPITVRNTGKTPAKNVTIRMFVEILEASQSPPLDWVSDHTHHPHNQITTGIFFPAAHIDQIMVRTRGKVTEPLVATRRKSMR